MSRFALTLSVFVYASGSQAFATVAKYASPPADDTFYQPPNQDDALVAEVLASATRTFAPRVFENAREFVAYYRPSRVPEFDRDEMHWVYQQYVAIVLFRSLVWSLNQFFESKPTAEQVRDLLNIPRHFARGQLHESPSGRLVSAAMIEILVNARARFGADPADWETIMGFRPQSAAEFESLRASVRAAPDDLGAWRRSLRGAVPPAPADFRAIAQNAIVAPSALATVRVACASFLRRHLRR